VSDIFGTEETIVADEAQATTGGDVQPAASTPQAVTKPAARKAEVEDANSKVVVTLKGGKGYEAPWVVLHCDTVAEANEALSDAALVELLDRASKAGAYFARKEAPAVPVQASAAPAGQGSPYGAPQRPDGISDKVWGLIQQGGSIKRSKPGAARQWVGIAPPKGVNGGLAFLNDPAEIQAVEAYFS
jgi:gp46